MKRALSVKDILSKKYEVFPSKESGRRPSTPRNVRVYGLSGVTAVTVRLLL